MRCKKPNPAESNDPTGSDKFSRALYSPVENICFTVLILYYVLYICGTVVVEIALVLCCFSFRRNSEIAIRMQIIGLI